MSVKKSIEKALRAHATPERAAGTARFFKTAPGEYGEGDFFLGVTMPQVRAVVRAHAAPATLRDATELLESKWHELRMAGALLLIELYRRANTESERAKIYRTYLTHTGTGINNWDLVDVSAEHVIGQHTFVKRDSESLVKLCSHKNLWKRRVGVLGGFHWIKQGDYSVTLACAALLLNDTEDLMHKAAGWMLREMGKRGGLNELRDFLAQYHTQMPRTMLRYAIERMSATERKKWMRK